MKIFKTDSSSTNFSSSFTVTALVWIPIGTDSVRCFTHIPFLTAIIETEEVIHLLSSLSCSSVGPCCPKKGKPSIYYGRWKVGGGEDPLSSPSRTFLPSLPNEASG